MKAYIGCFGSGLGHASRMIEVAQELKSRGHGVRLSSSGEVVPLLRSKGFECNDLPLADVRYSETGEFALRETLFASFSILARTAHQVELEIRNMERFAPDVVLSDSAITTVLAAKALGLPTFTVLNQLNLTGPHGREGIRSRILGVGISTGMGELWELSDEVLLPDLPPPYTISERNLWGSKVGKTRYIGFLTPLDTSRPDGAASEFRADERPKIFWPVSGPPATRTYFVKEALACAEALSDRYVFVVTGGSPTSDHSAKRIPGGWYYGWCDISGQYFRSCDLVVSRAGHVTIAQSVLASKPSIIVPISKQPEQEGNADKAARLGVAVRVDQESFGVDALSDAVKELLDGGYSENARMLGARAKSMDACRQVVETLERAAKLSSHF